MLLPLLIALAFVTALAWFAKTPPLNLTQKLKINEEKPAPTPNRSQEKRITEEQLPRKYSTKPTLMTPAEAVFFKILRNTIPEAPIFPKVRVADVLEATNRWSGDFLRISQKHFDWVLCHPETFEPIIAIELDDSSHQSAKAKSSDATKNEAAHEAGLTLLRFRWQREYDEESIRRKIADAVNAHADRKTNSL